jgi:hypothetical protein
VLGRLNLSQRLSRRLALVDRDAALDQYPADRRWLLALPLFLRSGSVSPASTAQSAKWRLAERRIVLGVLARLLRLPFPQHARFGIPL